MGLSGEEGEQGLIELVSVTDVEAVRPARDHMEAAAGDRVVRALPGPLDRDDGVGIAVDDQGRH